MDPIEEPHDAGAENDRATIGGLRYGGALTLSQACKVLSVVALFVGAASAWANLAQIDSGMSVSGTDKLAFVGGSFLTTILTAGALAFFGFMLEIGVGCWEQLWHLRYAQPFADEDVVDPDVEQPGRAD